METSMSLLDELARRVDCEILSDLRYLDRQGRGQLARAVEALSPDGVPLSQWNDALCYLTGEPPQGSCEEAQARLLAWLGRDC